MRRLAGAFDFFRNSLRASHVQWDCHALHSARLATNCVKSQEENLIHLEFLSLRAKRSNPKTSVTCIEIVSTTPLRFSLSTNDFQKIQILGSIIEHSPHENSTKQAYDNFFENTFDWDLDFTFLHETVNTVIET